MGLALQKYNDIGISGAIGAIVSMTGVFIVSVIGANITPLPIRMWIIGTTIISMGLCYFWLWKITGDIKDICVNKVISIRGS